MAKLPRVVTLLTDFTARDGYVASMKGVLLSRAPGVTIVDISHEIRHADVLAGAYVLDQVIDYFPPGTVHVVVIDPGVGTDRHILAARYGGQTIVAPDNGVITLVDARLPLENIVSVRQGQFALPDRVGLTFDGRDVMAPVAAALLTGTHISELGPAPATCKLLEIPEARSTDGIVRGEILYIDGFGNCVSNIAWRHVDKELSMAHLHVRAGEHEIGPIVGSYAHVQSGGPLALFNSIGVLEIAVNGGSAAETLGLKLGDPVVVAPETPA